MSEKVVVTKQKLVAIGDAIREKTETSAGLGLDEMPEAIQGIQTGADFTISDASNLFRDNARLENYQKIIPLFDKVTSMENMFYDCTDLDSVDLSILDTSNVSDMRNMFYGCNKSKSINVSNFSTPSLRYMAYMFRDCSNLENISLDNFSISNIETFTYLFAGCSKLKEFDMSKLNTRSLKSVDYMFSGCSALTKVILMNDMSRCTNMGGFFYNCRALEEIIGFSAPNKAGISIGFPYGNGTANRSALKRLTFRTDLPEGTYAIRSAINIKDCSFDREGMVEMLNTLPDITGAGVSASNSKITITGNPCITDGTLTDDDRAIATNKGWTLVE